MGAIINSVIKGTTAETPSGWYPPSYWPTDWEDKITDLDNGFVTLVAVYPDCDTYLAVLPTMSTSGGTIDWGDGNTGTVGASGVQIEHKFTYAGITTPLTAAGCKFAKVVIKFTGDLVKLDIARQHSSLSGTTFVSNSMVAVKLRTQNSYITIYGYSTIGGLNIAYWNLENTPLCTGSGITPFFSCLPVQKLVLSSFYSASQYGFNSGRVMNFNISDVDFSSVTNMQYFFSQAWFSDQAIEISINACTNMFAVLYRGYGIRSAKFTNTGSVTNINSACYDAHTCQYFEMDDCSSVTDTTNFVHAASGFGTLSGLKLNGLTVGINIGYQYLDATALNAFFTSLGTASGAQTIVVTGNPGAATCNTSIATAKGWTVTT